MSASLFLKYTRKAFRRYSKRFSRDFVFSGLNSETIHVLGNGPSLSESLSLIKDGDKVVMVNFAILSDLFFDLKPSCLCLADPFFFTDTGVDVAEQKKSGMLDALRRVDWPLEIIVPTHARIDSFQIDNDHLSFRLVNTVPIDFSVHFLRFWLYKQNLSMPSIQNVMVMGIYTAFQKGCKRVVLHGVDSDSYKNICINANNEMVLRDLHYYGSVERNLNDESFHKFSKGNLYERLNCEVVMFRSYIDLANYSRYLGIKVLNASPGSMIDAFKRYDHKEKVSETNQPL